METMDLAIKELTMDLAMEVKYMMTEYRLNIRVFTFYITVIIRKSAQCRKKRPGRIFGK